VAGNDVEQAIRQLADVAGSLTVDQRLRIAALLAQPRDSTASTPSTDNPASSSWPAESRVLTVEETADLLKVGRTTVYDLIKSGLLHSIMIGRLRRIRYTDVLTYLQQAVPP
jgi:excisionase family DNA binding protein